MCFAVRDAAYPKVENSVTKVLDVIKVVAHIAWLPLVLYIGYRSSEPRPSLLAILNPSPLN